TGGDPGRGLARRGPLEDVPDIVEPVFQGARKIGVPGPDASDRGRPLVALAGGRSELGCLVVGQPFDLHDPGPVVPVAIGDEQEQRRAERDAVADAARDVRLVVLDRLARTAAVATLASGEVDRQVIRPERQPGGHALDRDRQRPAMRFAGRQPAQASHTGVGSTGQAPVAPVAPDAPGPSAPPEPPAPAATVPSGSSPAGSPSADRTPPARAVDRAFCITSTGAGLPVQSVNAAAPWWRSISSPSATVQPAASASRRSRVRA